MQTGAFNLKNPLIVAVDVDSADACMEIVHKLGNRVGAYKLGPRLIVRYGADLIQKVAKEAPVFVDNKYLDIPSTMEGAVRASFEAGATLTTIHAWAGREALERLAAVERELNERRPFKILTVTILTSFSPETLPPALQNRPILTQVDELAELAFNCGLSGIVCSPQEIEVIRRRSDSAYVVTPGIRLPDDAAGDQKRIETPESAIRSGASAIVVGRPIIAAKDPAAAVERILESVQKGQKK